MPDEEVGFELAMPFVVCKSKGGPYDDAAYVAGWEGAYWDLELQRMGEFTTGHTIVASIHTDNQPQIDLIAMKHGWTATFDEPDPEFPGWLTVTFRLPDAENRKASSV